MLERMMQALSWIVNFSLLGEQGGATLGWGGAAGKIFPGFSGGAGNRLRRSEVGFSGTRLWILPSWWMPDWSLDRFYTQELYKKYMCPSEMHGDFTEIHKVLGHRGSLLLSNYRRDNSKFKIKVPFNKVKEVVKLCSSQCLIWTTECLDAL